MFEDICLHCGIPLPDDGSAYCSEDCSSLAQASPSVSSASSALSSPAFGFAHGGDVPPLVLPSVLGAALGKCNKHDTYYNSSSSASSNSWSLATDDDDDYPGFNADRGLSYRDGIESICDGSSKSANFVYAMNPSAALSYARRPSGTNTHSTVPQICNRSSPRSSPAPRHRRGTARSAPINSHSTTDDSEEFSDSSRELDSVDFPLKPSSSRRSRKRDSLPSYFNLLRINSSSTEAMKASLALSSSSNTVARASPPTPRNVYPSAGPNHFDVPRGRRRQVDRPSGESSPSRSRSRQIYGESPRVIRSRTVGDHGAEQPRGRSTMRRNSSPPSRLDEEVPARVRSALRDAERSQSNCSSRARGRGRVHVDELEGVGCFPLAPGYGNGRSGLMDRCRMAALVDRVAV